MLIDQLSIAADKRLATYLYLVNSDEGKYGSILKNLNSQRSLKNNQFPKTITDGNSIFSNNIFNRNFDKNKNFSKHKKKKNNNNKDKEETAAHSFT